MNFIRLIHFYAFTAITSSISAAPPSRLDCEVKGKYNPKSTIQKLATCKTLVFQDVQLSSNQQLNLTDLNGITIKFNGNITFAVRYNRIKLMHITGTQLNITASPSAWFIAFGEKYYDGGGYYTGLVKPMFAMIEVINSTLTGLKVLGTPAHAFMLAECHNSRFINFEVDDSAGDKNHLAKNTDGIHILQSSNITITGAIIHVQDDCACITSGYNVNITNITCTGGGFSAGSIGKNRINTVERVTFSASTITRSLYGLLIKIWPNTKGTVDRVTFENIALKDVRQQGIAITKGYTSKGLYSEPTTGVTITNLVIRNISGNVEDKGQSVMINCPRGECEKFTWKNVKILGGKATLMKSSLALTEAHYTH